MFVILIVCLVLTLIAFELLWNRDFKDCARKLPGFEILPLIGNAHRVPRNSADMYTLFFKMADFGPVSRLIVGPYLFIYLSDAADIEEVLINKALPEKPKEYDLLKTWIGQGLALADHDTWKIRRKLLTPAFKFNAMREYISIQERLAEVFMKKLESYATGKTFDIYPALDLFTLDVIGEATTGVRLNTQMGENNDYIKAIHDMTAIFMARFMNIFLKSDMIFKFTKRFKLQEKSLKIINRVTQDAITQRIHHSIKQNGINDGDTIINEKKDQFIDILLSSYEQGLLTDLDVRDEINTFLFAGQDTVATASGFIVYNLSRNSKIQEKVFNEQVSIFGNDLNKEVTYNDLSQMNYLEMVIKESLRLHPPAPGFYRKVTKPLTIRGVDIPLGCTIVVNILALGRSPDVFENPSEFIPERFEPIENAKRHPLSCIPFGAGHRYCIGQKFAMNEMKVLFSKLIRKYILLPDEFDLQIAMEGILRSINGIKIKLVKRPGIV